MTGTGSNVCAGIDAGSECSKLAYSDNLGSRVIARAEGADFVSLREDAEIFFDDIVSSCVVAVKDNTPSRQREALRVRALNSGFRNADVMGQFEAMTFGVNNDEARTLICDFGASGCVFAVIEAGDVVDEGYVDVGGNMFDKIFAEYLSELKLRKKADDFILKEAKRIKHILSDNNERLWQNSTIYRNDLERLIYFPVLRASHTLKRFLRVWKPQRFILTGGCAKIPLVREIFKGAEVDYDIIARGASLKGLMLSKQEARKNIIDNVSRIRALRAEIIGIEEKLTRQQKDRIYVLFRQAEGINDTGIIALMENLVREIKNA